MDLNIYEYFSYFFLASIKATKIRSPVIQNHVSDENRIIQTPILQIITKKGSVSFFRYLLYSYSILIFRYSKVRTFNNKKTNRKYS